MIAAGLLFLSLGLDTFAVAVIGGLSVSTLFTLVVAPVLFVSLERTHGPLARRMNATKEDCEAIEKELAHG